MDRRKALYRRERLIEETMQVIVDEKDKSKGPRTVLAEHLDGLKKSM